MSILKRTLLVILTPILTTLLFATVLDFGIVRTIGTPAPIKKTLADSGIYSSVVGSLLSQAKQSTGSGGVVSLTDPLIQKAANQTFTPQYLQTQTEGFIDSAYRWLNGVTPTPDFKLDLSPLKSSLANNVAADVQAKLATLPACTTAVDPSTYNPLTATCLPKGITPASAANTIKDNLVSGQGFLDNPVISADTIKQQGSSQSIFQDKLKQVPSYFSWVKKLPYISAGLTILVALAIVFLNSTKRKGLRHVGWTMIFVGAIMLAFAWGANYLMTKKFLPSLNLGNAVLQSKVETVGKDITQQIDKTYWAFGGTYVVLGVAAIVGPTVIGRGGNQSRAKGSQPKAPAGEMDEKPAEAEEEAEKPAKKTIKVQ